MTNSRVHAVLGEVKAEMARRDIRLVDLGPSAGLSPATLSRTFNGHREFTLGELDAVCQALDVPLVEMMRRAEQHGSVPA